jgi:aspartate/methionine/tyrosine aminotransferase
MKSEALADILLQKGGVAGVNGGSFGEYGEGYIRFSYANSLSNIMEAIERINRVSACWETLAMRPGQ